MYTFLTLVEDLNINPLLPKQLKLSNPCSYSLVLYLIGEEDVELLSQVVLLLPFTTIPTTTTLLIFKSGWSLSRNE